MSKPKDKGRYFENKIAKYLTTHDIPAERIPLSGSFGGRYNCDVVIGTPEAPINTIECKFRENISKQIWEWLGKSDYLAIQRSREQPLVVMRLDDFINLYKGQKSELGFGESGFGS